MGVGSRWFRRGFAVKRKKRNRREEMGLIVLPYHHLTELITAVS